MILTMKDIFSIVGFFSIVGIFFSCGDKLPSENLLKFELVTYQKKSELCDGVRDDNCAKIKIEFPQITSFSNEIVREKINKSIMKLFSLNESDNSDVPDFDAQLTGFIEEYKSVITEFPDIYQSWFIERTGEVKMNKADIFSVDYMEYSFTG